MMFRLFSPLPAAALLLLASAADLSAQNFPGWQPVAWQDFTRTQVLANSVGGLEKISGPNATWNADAVSSQSIVGDGAVEFKVRV